MSKKDKKAESATVYHFDRLKWFFIVLLLGAGIVANYRYPHVPLGIRAAAALLLCLVLLGIAAVTAKGNRAWGYLKAARQELRKVSWPTRQQAMQVTLIVIIFVIVMGLIMWGFDTVFLLLIKWLTAQ